MNQTTHAQQADASHVSAHVITPVIAPISTTTQRINEIHASLASLDARCQANAHRERPIYS